MNCITVLGFVISRGLGNGVVASTAHRFETVCLPLQVGIGNGWRIFEMRNTGIYTRLSLYRAKQKTAYLLWHSRRDNSRQSDLPPLIFPTWFEDLFWLRLIHKDDKFRRPANMKKRRVLISVLLLARVLLRSRNKQNNPPPYVLCYCLKEQERNR